MKKFLLRDLSRKDEQGNEEPFVYRDLLLLIVRTPSDLERGMSMDDVRRGIRLLDVIEPRKTGEVVEMEDADHEYLLSKLNAFRWARVDRRIVEFTEDLQRGDVAELNGKAPDQPWADPLEAAPA